MIKLHLIINQFPPAFLPFMLPHLRFLLIFKRKLEIHGNFQTLAKITQLPLRKLNAYCREQLTIQI